MYNIKILSLIFNLYRTQSPGAFFRRSGVLPGDKPFLESLPALKFR